MERIVREDGIAFDIYMAEANALYYAGRDPFGAGGDFITGPEISPLIGELFGLWLVSQWERQSRPSTFWLLELGPGRGTLMEDALTAARRVRPAFTDAARLALCETSPPLREKQAARLDRFSPTWISAPQELADDGMPLFALANEFFDALPVRQFVRHSQSPSGWLERHVVPGTEADGDALRFTLKPPRRSLPRQIPADAPESAVYEFNPIGAGIAAWLAARVERTGGAALICDYGYSHPAFGDTVQAVRAHKAANPLASPGSVDLTAQVDFSALREAALAQGACVQGPVAQGPFLRALGIMTRLAQVLKSRPGERGQALATGALRLIDEATPQSMGRLFKVMAVLPSAFSKAAAEGF